MHESKKHFIILGAGASYDFIHEEYLNPEVRADWNRFGKPPLAAELFDPARFGSVLDKYEGAKNLAVSVLSALRMGKDLEEFMQEVASRGDHRTSELVEMIFYLGELFQTISDKYSVLGINNYRDLIGRIKDSGGGACIVSFNYDFLLESALGNQFQKGNHKLSDYIEHPVQIIKIHGCCEWSYVLGPYGEYDAQGVAANGGVVGYLANNSKTVYGIGEFGSVEKSAPEIIPKRNFRKDSQNRWGDPIKYYSYPALAVPMRTKHSHICPESHMDALKDSLSGVEKILIIGWKAADENLLEIFKETISQPVEFTIVAGKGSTATDEIKKRISEKVPHSQFRIVDEGFTGFMSSNACDSFFGQ
ncbi:MAG: hypothetical protein ACJKSS_01055 [Patescibacteria group bacterium UBA2103]